MRRCTNFDSCNSEALYQREMYLTFLKTSNLYLYLLAPPRCKIQAFWGLFKVVAPPGISTLLRRCFESLRGGC